ncbi:unnamed protein product [Leuciscus chuanchicus]
MNRLTLKLFDSRMLRHRRDPSAPVRDSCPPDEQTNTEAVRLEDAETQKRSVRSESIKPKTTTCNTHPNREDPAVHQLIFLSGRQHELRVSVNVPVKLPDFLRLCE